VNRLSVLAAACGRGSSTPASPTSAAAATSAPSPTGATSGAVISGTVVGVTSASQFAPRAVGLTVTVTGSSATATVDASGRFTLINVPTGHVDLHFTGAGTDAHLGLDNVADHQTVTITVRVSGSSAQMDTEDSEDAGGVEVITATEIELQGPSTPVPSPTPTPSPTPNPGGGDDGHGNGDGNATVDLSGSIATKSGTCPALTLTIGSTKVVTSASTSFKETFCDGWVGVSLRR
jgi:hypothetical protein